MLKRKGKKKSANQIQDNNELSKCVRCGKQEAEIMYFKGLYYVQCPCGKYDRWQFCGIRPRGAIDSWNYENRPIHRGKKRPDEME